MTDHCEDRELVLQHLNILHDWIASDPRPLPKDEWDAFLWFGQHMTEIARLSIPDSPSPVDRGDGGVTIEQLDATAEMLRLGGVTLGGKFALEVVALARQALSAPAPAREDIAYGPVVADEINGLAYHCTKCGERSKYAEREIRSLRSTIATLAEQEEKLVEFFRNELPAEGWIGDQRGDSPAESAIRVMRQLQSGGLIRAATDRALEARERAKAAESRVATLEAELKEARKDSERLNALEATAVTVYRCDPDDGDHWVVVPEKRRSRRGHVASTLRAAIDDAFLDAARQPRGETGE